MTHYIFSETEEIRAHLKGVRMESVDTGKRAFYSRALKKSICDFFHPLGINALQFSVAIGVPFNQFKKWRAIVLTDALAVSTPKQAELPLKGMPVLPPKFNDLEHLREYVAKHIAYEVFTHGYTAPLHTSAFAFKVIKMYTDHPLMSQEAACEAAKVTHNKFNSWYNIVYPKGTPPSQVKEGTVAPKLSEILRREIQELGEDFNLMKKQHQEKYDKLGTQLEIVSEAEAMGLTVIRTTI